MLNILVKNTKNNYQLVNESISQQFAIANAEKLLIQLSQSVLESFFRTS